MNILDTKNIPLHKKAPVHQSHMRKNSKHPSTTFLKDREVNTLDALYVGGPGGFFNNYGRSIIQNMQPGYLPDIKG
jgi:hypothetical protein